MTTPLSSWPRRLTRAIVDGSSALIPLSAYPALALLEGAVARAQGRGFGTRSIREEVAAILPFLPDHGAILIDVGANEGEWSRTVLRRAGKRISHVFAFEPSATHATALGAISDERFELLACAVGARAEVRPLYTDTPGSGAASLYQRDLAHLGVTMLSEERVPVVTLDEFFESRSIDVCDALKMDIEGHELEALHGAQSILARRKVRLLTFEMGGCNVDSRTYFRDFWSLLTGYGFDLFRVVPGGRLYRISNYAEHHEFFSPTNYVGILR